MTESKKTNNQKPKVSDQEFDKSQTAKFIFAKATGLSLVFAFLMLFFTGLVLAIWGLAKLNNFTSAANTSVSEIASIVRSGWNSPVTHTNFKKNFLLLGIDTLESRPGSPALTDTIMLISLDIKTGEISTISLPRDLWNLDYITRINALYFYGQERFPAEPEKFAEETIEEMTGVEIHHTLVVSIESVAEIIDILGGIEVDVENGFTDTQFPRPNVDVTVVRDPELLYQTISFEPGIQTMDGERALQFIRSRKSGDDQGDDLARAKRQQLVINSLVQKLSSFELLKNEKVLANLYRHYNENYSQQFSIEEGIATLRAIAPIREKISFSGQSISIYPENEYGVITNPPTYKYNGQWVYEILDEEEFEYEIQTKLGLR